LLVKQVYIFSHYWVLNFKNRSLKSFVDRTCRGFLMRDDLN
jgi:hypothetical protein